MYGVDPSKDKPALKLVPAFFMKNRGNMPASCL